MLLGNRFGVLSVESARGRCVIFILFSFGCGKINFGTRNENKPIPDRRAAVILGFTDISNQSSLIEALHCTYTNSHEADRRLWGKSRDMDSAFTVRITQLTRS